MREKVREFPGTNVIFFYCKQTDERRGGLLNVVKSLLAQMMRKNDSILQFLFEEACKSGEAVLSTSVVAKKVLEDSLKNVTDSKRTYIVLDGLDEFDREDRKELCHWFQQLVSSLPKGKLGSIRCLFVSQEDGFARKDLSLLSQIKISSIDNRADIEAYCGAQHKEIETKFGPLERPEHHVKNVVSAQAQGQA